MKEEMDYGIIESLKFGRKMSLYLTEREIKKALHRISPYVLIILLGFTMWFCQMVVATASTPTYTVISTYHVH